MEGFLLVDKPTNWTSFDVVAKIRSEVRRATDTKHLKVGHAGTLDPFATGLLIVLIGSYTKQQDAFMKQDKVYEASVRLGAVSTTLDPEGEITQHKVVAPPSSSDVERVLSKFVGVQQQLPPAHSAIKINGKRSYELARKGQTPDLQHRTVEIYALTTVVYEWPMLRFSVHVSSGTYIRSLAADIGASLGTGGYLKELRRINIGQYSVTDAVTIEQCTADNLKKHLRKTE